MAAGKLLPFFWLSGNLADKNIFKTNSKVNRDWKDLSILYTDITDIITDFEQIVSFSDDVTVRVERFFLAWK